MKLTKPTTMKFSLVLLFVINALPCQSQTVWPQPQTIITRSDLYLIDPNNFDFIPDGNSNHQQLHQNCSILYEAFNRYKELMFNLKCPGEFRSKPSKKTLVSISSETEVKMINNITYDIGFCPELPGAVMDELYFMYIGNIQRGTFMYGSTSWGMIRGLETLSQLLYPVLYEGREYFAMNGTYILDFPRFSFRGVMIDTSRHFIPVPVLKQNLDAMAYNKFNVFHWHLVDDQSFPYESTNFPELSEEGAYDAETHVYSKTDVKDIIEYARLRGIRVIPEFDSPGHSLSWGKSLKHKDLLSKCYDINTGQLDGTRGPIDPTNEDNYEFLYDFFKEIKNVFPDEYLHLGGDEVDFSCWQSSPVIQKFMREKDIQSYEDLEGYFIEKLYNKLKPLNKTHLFWQEVFDNRVELDRKTSVIHVWKNWGERIWFVTLQEVTAAGFRAVLSAPWYLDYISYGADWTKYYDVEPFNFTGTDTQKELILGGSACMWTEYVDGSSIIPRIWPRASAVAERLWSNINVKDKVTALPRIKRMQCLMQKRGLRVNPIDGPGFCSCDHSLR